MRTRNDVIDDLRAIQTKLDDLLMADAFLAAVEDRKALVDASNLLGNVINRLMGDNYQESKQPKL